MKKLFLILAVASMFIAGTAIASTWTATMVQTPFKGTLIPGTTGPLFDSSGGLASPITLNSWTFTMDNTTGVMDWPAGVVTTGPGDPVVAPSTDNTSAMTIWQGGTWNAGTQNYDANYANLGVDPSHGDFTAVVVPGSVTYYLAIYGVRFDYTGADGDWTDGTLRGVFAIGQDYSVLAVGNCTAGLYEFTAQIVPIPGAVWLLLSGLVGIIGLRKRN